MEYFLYYLAVSFVCFVLYLALSRSQGPLVVTMDRNAIIGMVVICLVPVINVLMAAFMILGAIFYNLEHWKKTRS